MQQFAQAADELQDGHTGAWLTRFGQFGYYAKGVVYAVMGLLALRTATGTAARAEGPQGTLLEIATQPFGLVLLSIIAVGLAGHSIWRFVEARLDPNGVGSDVRGILTRVACAVSGLTHAALAVWAASAVFGQAPSGVGHNAEREWTAMLMSQPLGRWLVGLVGLILLGVALAHFYEVYQTSFMNHYRRREMSGQERAWSRRLGRAGLAALGVTFFIIGTFVILAAWRSDPTEARGLGEALQTLVYQPYGPWLLGAVAIGFIAYGASCAARARYGRFAENEPGGR